MFYTRFPEFLPLVIAVCLKNCLALIPDTLRYRKWGKLIQYLVIFIVDLVI